jgi:hypothetical protein
MPNETSYVHIQVWRKLRFLTKKQGREARQNGMDKGTPRAAQICFWKTAGQTRDAVLEHHVPWKVCLVLPFFSPILQGKMELPAEDSLDFEKFKSIKLKYTTKDVRW